MLYIETYVFDLSDKNFYKIKGAKKNICTKVLEYFVSY